MSDPQRLRGDWAPVDTGLLRDRRMRGLSAEAKLLHVAALLYANAQMTDGEITASDLRLVAAEADVETGHASELVSAGLWEGHRDYRIAAFAGLSREERLRRRDLARARKQRFQERHNEPAEPSPKASEAEVTRSETRSERDFPLTAEVRGQRREKESSENRVQTLSAHAHEGNGSKDPDETDGTDGTELGPGRRKYLEAKAQLVGAFSLPSDQETTE